MLKRPTLIPLISLLLQLSYSSSRDSFFIFAEAQNATTTTRPPTEDDATQPLAWWVVLVAALVAFPILLLSCYFLVMWQQKAMQDYKTKHEEMLKVLRENTRRVQEQANAAKAKRKAEAEAEAAANASNPLYVPELEKDKIGEGDDDMEAEDIARALADAREEIREGLLKGGRGQVGAKGPMMPIRIPTDWREPLDRSVQRAPTATTRSYIRSAAPIYLSPSASPLRNVAKDQANDDWNVAGGTPQYQRRATPQPTTASGSAEGTDPFSLESIAADAAAAHRALRDLKKAAPLRHLESLI